MGATLVVFGGYQAIGDTVRLDGRLVEVESGRTIKAVFETARAAKVPELLTALPGRRPLISCREDRQRLRVFVSLLTKMW